MVAEEEQQDYGTIAAASSVAAPRHHNTSYHHVLTNRDHVDLCKLLDEVHSFDPEKAEELLTRKRELDADIQENIVLHEQEQQQQSQPPGKNDENTDPDMNPLTKSSWYAVEAFGKVFGNNKKNKDKKTQSGDPVKEYDFSQPPQSLKETLERIKLDNDRAYFLSGQVDEEVYDENCVFRDPFVSFEGRQRFVENLANLGSFITNYSAKVLNYNDEDPTMVQTK
ncbi:MAG: hypothetical protein SGBAC_013059, partial [Bacillariaceae sp.]